MLRRENVAPTGVTHLNFGQQIADLEVYGTYVRAALSPQGEILSLIENLAEAPPALVQANISARGALDAVLSEYYPGTGGAPDEIRTTGQTVVFARNGRFSEEPTATRVAVPMNNGSMHTGYLVVTWDNDNILRHTVVGAGGRILVEELRTNSDTYKIVANHPGVSAQTVVAGPRRDRHVLAQRLGRVQHDDRQQRGRLSRSGQRQSCRHATGGRCPRHRISSSRLNLGDAADHHRQPDGGGARTCSI